MDFTLPRDRLLRLPCSPWAQESSDKVKEVKSALEFSTGKAIQCINSIAILDTEVHVPLLDWIKRNATENTGRRRITWNRNFVPSCCYWTCDYLISESLAAGGHDKITLLDGRADKSGQHHSASRTSENTQSATNFFFPWEVEWIKTRCLTIMQVKSWEKLIVWQLGINQSWKCVN